MIRRSILLIALLPAIAACSSGSTASIGPTEGVPSGGRPSFAMSSPFKTAPATSAPVTGEVPAEVMIAATADLASRTGLDPTTFKVVHSEQAMWPDGSLGCRVPGQMYIQVVTPGYWIVLEADGKPYDYRATDKGVVRMCDEPTPQPPSG